MILPKVSIITVVYNAKDLFEKTISNIISLKYPNKEIIVIDGGSTDGTKAILEENSLKIDIWISEPDNGIYDAMNKALRIATGEYVWFINAGDLAYSPYVLEDIFKGRDLCHDIYYGDTLIVNENNKVLGLRKKKLPKKLTKNSFLNGMVVCHQSFIARRKLLNAFDLKYRHSADYEQMIKAVRDSKSIYRINDCLSIFMEGGHTSANRKAGLKERFEIMNRHFGLFKTIIAHIKITFKAPFSHYHKNEH
ncbi:MAG: glycosyltransferase [Bacteroidetes bacterium]|nr:glycosyltransferase [Bacteroidota bacterium]